MPYLQLLFVRVLGIWKPFLSEIQMIWGAPLPLSYVSWRAGSRTNVHIFITIITPETALEKGDRLCTSPAYFVIAE